ncbi:MAG: aminodeoxychorismate/anthranilate synthase component II [Paraglaciecola sp.]|nr:aminodeoxychorismate/anthranilate synthase component II [Paraglaciecola sp.]
MTSRTALNKTPTCVFLLDNFDSFTYNLEDELGTLGLELIVYRNSGSAEIILQKMHHEAQKTDKNGHTKQVMLMLSPGPGSPSQAGSMLALLDLVKGQFPVLGICLGHQAIVESYGGNIIHASKVMHGKSSLIEHCGDKMFANMPQPLPVARYHSLMASNIPDELTVLANFADIPMAVAHIEDRMLGFQFHPESILTSHGSQLLMQSIEFLTQDKV